MTFADEKILLEESGQKIFLIQAYPHRGKLLQSLCHYGYISIAKLKK
jgi:hypothetical protein